MVKKKTSKQKNAFLIGGLILLLLIISVAIANNSDLEDVSLTVVGDCFDSDNGVNAYVKGKVVNTLSGEAIRDYCINTNLVSEAYCSGTQEPSISEIICPSGTSCEDGRCIQTVGPNYIYTCDDGVIKFPAELDDLTFDCDSGSCSQQKLESDNIIYLGNLKNQMCSLETCYYCSNEIKKTTELSSCSDFGMTNDESIVCEEDPITTTCYLCTATGNIISEERTVCAGEAVNDPAQLTCVDTSCDSATNQREFCDCSPEHPACQTNEDINKILTFVKDNALIIGVSVVMLLLIIFSLVFSGGKRK